MSQRPQKLKEDGYVWVRSIFGKGPNAKEQYEFIPSGGTNELIARWHAKQAQREFLVASPSSILTCPRVVWLQSKGVEHTNPMTWAKQQRNLLGKLAENLFARQFADEGILLHHWRDSAETDLDSVSSPDKFTMGEGEDRLEGTPDFLLKLWEFTDKGPTGETMSHLKTTKDVIAVSDAKTSRSDSFGYVPIGEDIWKDWGWYKNRIQLTAYYMLCHANKDWFDRVTLLPRMEKLPLPEVCHLFSYALDDGIVRREMTWEPTQQDMSAVRHFTRQFNNALASETMPDCTCAATTDQFEQRFCRYGIPVPGKKVCEDCCDDSLIEKVGA